MMTRAYWLSCCFAAVAMLIGGVPAFAQDAPALDVTESKFGSMPDGTAVMAYTLTNGDRMRVQVISYGGIVTRLEVPDRDGKLGDVVLGFDNLEAYLAGHPYFGCIAGRYANRIAEGKFTLAGKEYTLATNNPPNHLHGGVVGFDKVVWESEAVRRDGAVGVRLTHTSPDGDEGYPGKLTATVTYWLTDKNELRVRFRAETDAPTHVNLAHHGYFNLNGEGSGDILDHELMLHAAKYTPVDEHLIPTGIKPVAGTPLDFTTATAIGARIDAEDVQLERGGGYDHNFVIDRDGKGLAPAATVYAPKTGRVMEVLTTQPGIQFYAGNFLDGTLTGKGGGVYGKRAGFCLETQHFPDTPNHPSFPTSRLNPGQAYKHTCVYRFSTR